MIKRLTEDREEYLDYVWVSSTGVRTKVIEMTNDYLLNVLRKVAQKSVLAQQLKYVEEFQMYEGKYYSEWCKALYTEYLYRKHSSIVIEQSVADSNPIDNTTDPAVVATEYFNNIQSNNGIYQIS